jgi:hypothetical protein
MRARAARERSHWKKIPLQEKGKKKKKEEKKKKESGEKSPVDKCSNFTRFSAGSKFTKVYYDILSGILHTVSNIKCVHKELYTFSAQKPPRPPPQIIHPGEADLRFFSSFFLNGWPRPVDADGT